MMYTDCGALADIESTTYMTVMELFDEYPAPFSPEMMTITSILNDIIFSVETERSTKACC